MARILVVEDNAKSRRLLQMVLKNGAHEVVCAEDGLAALAAVGESKPDLIVMDLQLPALDGYEVTRRLKADPALRHIPVVAVSAYAMPSDRQRGLDAGCDAYVCKPIDIRAFAETVRVMLARSAGA